MRASIGRCTNDRFNEICLYLELVSDSFSKNSSKFDFNYICDQPLANFRNQLFFLGSMHIFFMVVADGHRLGKVIATFHFESESDTFL